MIKLVASDIDGTLLVEGSDKINEEIFDVILKLKDQGTLFAAASGRQYASIRRLFAPIENEMIFVSENGSNVVCRGYEMSSTVLNRQDAEELIRFIRTQPGCYLTASTRGPMYIEDDDADFLKLLTEGYHNDMRLVQDVLKEEIEIIKISIYKSTGVQDIAEEVVAQWEDRFHVTIAGEPWIDFMDFDADKGKALQTIQQTLRISREETMVFGDNNNDLGMIASAEESYAVANAQPKVLEAAKHIADENVNDGVLKVLKTLLDSKGGIQMYKYDDVCLKAFLENQLQLFDEKVAETLEEADEFLDDVMAVTVNTLEEVRDYFEEAGMDTSDMSGDELEEASEVFHLPDGRYLIVEG